MQLTHLRWEQHCPLYLIKYAELQFALKDKLCRAFSVVTFIAYLQQFLFIYKLRTQLNALHMRARLTYQRATLRFLFVVFIFTSKNYV